MPCAQSQIDTVEKCKRVLDSAGLSSKYDDRTPPAKLRILAAGVMHARAGVPAVEATVVPDIEVTAQTRTSRARMPMLRAARIFAHFFHIYLRPRAQAMTLADLDRLHAVLKSAGELQGAFDAKKGWVKIRALIAEVHPGFLVNRHSSTCSGRVNDGVCGICGSVCLQPQADYYGFVTVKDWQDPNKMFDVPFSTAAGTGLFGVAPNIMNIKSATEIRADAATLKMMPYKIVVKICWNAARNEVSYLMTSAKPIDTEDA